MFSLYLKIKKYIFCLFAQVIQEQIRLVFTVFANLNEQQIDLSLSLFLSVTTRAALHTRFHANITFHEFRFTLI